MEEKLQTRSYRWPDESGTFEWQRRRDATSTTDSCATLRRLRTNDRNTRDDPRAAIFVAGERDVLFSRREKSWADKRRAGQLTFVSQQRIGVV